MRSIDKQPLEVVTSPLDCVLNLVWEVLQSAERDSFLSWVLGVSIALGELGHYHLGVALGPESSGLEKSLLVPDTPRVNIKSCLDVIHSVHNEVETIPEGVIKSDFVLWVYSEFERVEVDFWVHSLSGSTCNLTLVPSDILLSEQELSVQVTDLDVVIVSHADLALGSDSHQGEHFDELASKSPSSDKECVHFPGIGDEFISEKVAVVRVSVLSGGSGCGTFGENFEEVVVEPLPQWGVFSCQLHYLLADDSSPEGSSGGDLEIGESCNIFDHFLIYFVDSKLSLNLHCGF